MLDELSRAAVEQGAHDGGNPKNKKDERTRDRTRPDERAFEHIIYRAACYKRSVRMVGTRYYLSRLTDAQKRSILDAYHLARG